MSTVSRAIVGALVLAAAVAGGYAYYSNARQAGMAAKAPPAPPPADVGVVEVRTAEIPLSLVYAGRVAGFRTVEVRAQVNGVILKREFVEGERVKEGDVLFRIDPRPYQAALDRANAQLGQAQATFTQAEENFGRIEELSKRQVATAKQLDDARAARDQSRAAVLGAQADIQTARLNIEFTTVKAPVSGPTSLVSPPEGSLAQTQQTLLTTITQLDPAYVNFSTSDSEFRELRVLNESRAGPLSEDDITVSLRFGDGLAYRAGGKINVSANTIDPRTGTVQVRAIFPNPDGDLLPNQFVRVEVKGVTLPNSIVIPQQAVSQGPQGASVYVVNAQNVAETRQIKLDREIGKGWVVKDGLKDGERIVADGVMRVRPGATVKPTLLTAEAVTNPAPAAAPAPAPAGAK
jgi:membrane fusion protein (multidrug efflux system)